jgi:hypothetical protein
MQRLTALLLIPVFALATCTPDVQSGCPSTAPATGDIAGTAYTRTGVTGIHVLQAINYNTSFTNCTPSSGNVSCDTGDCFWPLGAGASTGMEVSVHSGGGNSGARDGWLSLGGYGPIVFAQLTKRVHCNIDYRLAPGAPYPAISQDLSCFIYKLVADAGSTIPGNRQDIVLLGDSWSAIPTLNLALNQGVTLPWSTSCSTAASTNYHISGVVSAYGILCIASGCTNTAYHNTLGSFLTTAVNNSLGSTNEATAITADASLQMSPIQFMTQGNPNLRLIRAFFYGVNDALVCHQVGIWDGSSNGCGGTAGSQSKMNDWQAVTNLAALVPPVIVKDFGYTELVGHEAPAIFTGDVRTKFYQDYIAAINNFSGSSASGFSGAGVM